MKTAKARLSIIITLRGSMTPAKSTGIGACLRMAIARTARIRLARGPAPATISSA
ncbi:hypothetical protein D3C72_2453620 [compost metagenome]